MKKTKLLTRISHTIFIFGLLLVAYSNYMFFRIGYEQVSNFVYGTIVVGFFMLLLGACLNPTKYSD